MNTPNKVQLYTGLILVGTFALGTLTGAGISQWSTGGEAFFPKGPPRPPSGLPPFDPWSLAKLELSPEQEQAVHKVFETHRPQLDAVLREGFPKVQAITEEIDKSVRALLQSDQQEQFDTLRKERQERRRRMGKPGAGPPSRWGKHPRFRLPH